VNSFDIAMAALHMLAFSWAPILDLAGQLWNGDGMPEREAARIEFWLESGS
jgi:hypothetical protein